MNKLDNFVGCAPKTNGSGTIMYVLWFDDNGATYVQMSENQIDTETPGTFSNFVFPIAKHAQERHLDSALTITKGYNLNTSKLEEVSDNNNSGFLKAVLLHLLPVTVESIA